MRAGGHGGTDSPQRHGGRQVKKRQTDWGFQLGQRADGGRACIRKGQPGWIGFLPITISLIPLRVLCASVVNPLKSRLYGRFHR